MHHLKKKLNKNNKGIILIEALLALAVITVVIVALATALISALNSASYSDDQTVATGYAQEGLDLARAEKNYDFSNFSNNVGYLNGSLDGGKFQRTIIINADGTNPNGEDCVQEYIDPLGNRTEVQSYYVASIVEWSDSRCSGGNKCHKVSLDSCFANLNFIDIP